MLKDSVNHAFEKSFNLLKGTTLHHFSIFLEKCLTRLNQPMQVAVIGEICASKSTLVNAILGEEEIVRTGRMEETFNVSWLKYGSSESEIIVHFKQPKEHIESIKRDQWAVWANRLGQESMKQSISFIEVLHDNPSLEKINLIDTPGLNAHYSIDSQNTLDFLQKMRPDAVIFIFTKSIAQRSIDVIKTFQGRLAGDITPINAIGVISKIDAYWPDESDPVSSGRRIADRLFTSESSVKNSLYRIYPVCASLALGAKTINNNDLELFKVLVALDKKTRKYLFSSARRFQTEDVNIPVSADQRKYLINKFTIYGIYCSIDTIENNSNISLEELKKYLLNKSGFDVFYDSINKHFGNRSYLIKLSGVFSDIRNYVNYILPNSEGIQKSIIQEIGNIFIELTLKQHEFQELELLKQFYNGEIYLSELEEADLKNITGENGLSCAERLGLTQFASIDEMKNTAQAKHDYWHRKFVIFSPHPAVKNASNIIKKSYRCIGQEIEEAEFNLNKSAHFLWGQDFGLN